MDDREYEHEKVVNDLQDQMTELKTKLDQQLREAVNAYENDLRDMKQELFTWKARSQDMESLMLEERRKRLVAEKQLAILNSEGRSLVSGDDQDGIRSQQDPQVLSTNEQAYPTPPEVSVGCGRCTAHSHCQCMEEVFGLQTEPIVDDAQTQKRSPSPLVTQQEANKRLKQENGDELEQPLETDFTDFNPTTAIDATIAGATAVPPVEPCGFCQDGSTCLCAELAADKARMVQEPATVPSVDSNPLTLPMKGSNAKTPASGCTNDPGTCAKCRSDPTSTLLCKTLAATQPESLRAISSVARSTEPCPLGAACCRVSKTLDMLPTSAPSNTLASFSRGQAQVVTGPTISCADAFTTLSRHPAFERASKDIGEWLPRLVTIPSLSGKPNDAARDASEGVARAAVDPGTGSTPSLAGRTAFDIEAASVMGVLRMFDRRFGKES